jgi:hypothetical protein
MSEYTKNITILDMAVFITSLLFFGSILYLGI